MVAVVDVCPEERWRIGEDDALAEPVSEAANMPDEVVSVVVDAVVGVVVGVAVVVAAADTAFTFADGESINDCA